MMDSKHEHEDEHAAPESTAASTVTEEPADPRLQRIMEYLQTSLDNDDALQANLNAASADLMVIGYRLATAIKEAMATAPESLEAYGELVPAIGNLLRIHKQVDRFSSLNSRLASAKALATTPKSPLSGVVGLSEDMKC